MKTMEIAEPLLTWDQIANRWGVSKRQCHRIARESGIDKIDLGHKTKRFTLSAVVALENRRKVAAKVRVSGGRGRRV